MEQEMNRYEEGAFDHIRAALGRVNWRTLAIATIVLVLLLTRLYDLGNRSYSHDESIHAWESWKVATAQNYRHDPVYHGPFMYHLVGLFYVLFGITDVTARVVPALFAVGVALSALPLRRWIGRSGAVFALLLLTLSPSMMFRGRFIRHDVFVMLPAMVIVISAFSYLEDRRQRWLYLSAAAMACFLSTKATSYIYAAIFGTFFFMYLLVEWWTTRKALRDLASFDLVVFLGTMLLPWGAAFFVKMLGMDPLDYSSAQLVRTGLVVAAVLGAAAAVGLWWNRRAWLISSGIFWSIFIVLYTSLFTNAKGAATGLMGMLGYWLGQQGVKRGGQPWYYYLFMLSVYEFLLLVLTRAGLLYYVYRLFKPSRSPAGKPALECDGGTPEPSQGVRRPARAMPLFLLYWWVFSDLIYAWSGEKMPWLTMNLTLPMGLFGGWFLGQVWDRTHWKRLFQRGAAYGLILLPVALFSAIVLANATLAKPFSGASMDQLEITLRWLLSLLLLVISLGFIRSLSRRLAWAGWGRLAFWWVTLVLMALTLRSALTVSFKNPDMATEFLVYAASTPDTGPVTRELHEMARRFTGDHELKVAYDNESSWPFVWYLRDFPGVSYFAAGGSPPADMDVVIVGPGNESKIKGQLAGKYMRRQYRLIWWPNQDVYANLTPAKLWADLKDPARRKFWWDIWWSRKYEQSTTAWPYVQNFALYVRKDIAAQMWDYGPEVAGTGITLPEDQYEKQRVDPVLVSSWGAFGTTDGQFNYPKDVALDSQGNVYVADSFNHRIAVFDSQGAFLRSWGTQGNQPGQFQEPWGIAIDAEDNVYVADTWNHRVQKFDAQGRFVRQWGAFGDTAGGLADGNLLYGPRDVVVDLQGNVWVSDTGNKRVLQFGPDGEFLQQLGGEGSAPGQFREPVGLAVDGNDNLYVADTWNERIQKFDAQGTYLAEWSVLGWEGQSVVNKPYLAVDGQGRIYASGPEYHRVLQFDGSGKLLALWGQFGTEGADLNMPAGIVVGPAGDVFVADSANHRIVHYGPVS